MNINIALKRARVLITDDSGSSILDASVNDYQFYASCTELATAIQELVKAVIADPYVSPPSPPHL